MSRLLFAAARGARIQTWAGVLGWRSTNLFGPWSYDDGDRIHPDDAHLQYGQISTALRNYALGLPLVETCWFSKLLLHTDGDLYTLSPNDRYVFLLLMAEALADEGM